MKDISKEKICLTTFILSVYTVVSQFMGFKKES